MVVLPCPDLDAAVAFFTGKLGFRIDAVFPADDPAVVEISGDGLHLRLDRRALGDPGVLRIHRDGTLPGEEKTVWTAPNGTRIHLVPPDPPVYVPSLEPGFGVTRTGDGGGWHRGRAGMEYRDLIPGRQGGWIIASHIRIPEGGPVPDYVHFHKIRFQMIYCLRGWVRVVYEDQGAPFVLEEGDCVLQPPRIRHRVLESSPGLEVIEVSCPAEHETRVDHGLHLPNIGRRTERKFEGQKFLRHVAAGAVWSKWRADGFQVRDTGLTAATGGVGGVTVVRPEKSDVSSEMLTLPDDLVFFFVSRGTFSLRVEGQEDEMLEAGDGAVLPPGASHALAGCSGDLDLLEVILPVVETAVRSS